MQVVNGYVCNTCTDVSNAKKGVDPAHPKDPPASVDDPFDRRGPAVTLGGRLQRSDPARESSPGGYAPGATVNISA